MSRDYRLYLDDMLSSCRKVLRHAHGLPLDQFVADDLLRDAVVFNLQIIGEAASRIPAEVRARYPEVEWQKAIGLRNIIVHGYFALVDQLIWETVQTSLPVLLEHVERILAESSPP